MIKTEILTEVLVENYQTATGFEKEIILQEVLKRMEGLIVNICKDYWNIPHLDFEDKKSELQMELVRVLDYYDKEKGAKFSTVCSTFFRKRMNKMYTTQTRQKRMGETVSLEYLLTENGEKEITDKDSTEIISLKEYSDVELYEMLDTIGLSEKEYITCELIIQGVKKTDIAKTIGVTPPMIRLYLESVGKKMVRNNCYAL